MTAREQGFLLLTSCLGDSTRKKLTLTRFRELILRSKEAGLEDATILTQQQLLDLGYDRVKATHIADLFSEADRLAGYLRMARREGCCFLTLGTEGFPEMLSLRLGMDCPTVLWGKGDLSLLFQPGISLVGSRDLNPENFAFAQEVGRWAAENGFILISGNARGADRAGQEACLAAGGKVVSVVADKLTDKKTNPNILYIAEDSFDLPFANHRALSRNRIIHALGARTYVAQCTLGKGGTWDGTTKNLQKGWSPVYCFDDGSAAARELIVQGAEPITNL